MLHSVVLISPCVILSKVHTARASILKSAFESLADELINAYNLSPNSMAISKKNEVERQSDSAR